MCVCPTLPLSLFFWTLQKAPSSCWLHSELGGLSSAQTHTQFPIHNFLPPWSLHAVNFSTVFSMAPNFLGCKCCIGGKSMGYNTPCPVVGMQNCKTCCNCMHSQSHTHSQKEGSPLNQWDFHSPCIQGSPQHQRGRRCQVVQRCPPRFPAGRSWGSALGKSGRRVVGTQLLWSHRRTSRTARCRHWPGVEGSSPRMGCCMVHRHLHSKTSLCKAGGFQLLKRESWGEGYFNDKL